MEQSRKYLKWSSVAVLSLVGVYILELISELLWGEINSAVIPEGASENILLITKIFIVAVSVLLLLPQIYVGIKGLIIAKKPTCTKAHIVWAVILLVFAAVGVVDPIVGLINGGGVYDNVKSLSGIALELVVYYDYIKYAREVRKGC
jgi:hypothetical protein